MARPKKEREKKTFEVSLGRHKFKEEEGYRIFPCDTLKEGCKVHLVIPSEISKYFENGEELDIKLYD